MNASAARDGTRRSVARHAGHRFSVRRVLAFAAVVVGAAVIATVTGTSGTFALLTAGGSTSEASTVLTSGTAELTVSTITMPTTALYPGLTISGPVSVTNTGTVPLSLSVSGLTGPDAASSSAFSSALLFGVGTPAPGQSCSSGGGHSTWTGSFASAVPGTVGVTVPAGASRELCVSVTLPRNAPSATQTPSTVDFLLHLIGTQA